LGETGAIPISDGDTDQFPTDLPARTMAMMIIFQQDGLRQQSEDLGHALRTIQPVPRRSERE
jgi:xylose isomerase